MNEIINKLYIKFTNRYKDLSFNDVFNKLSDDILVKD